MVCYAVPIVAAVVHHGLRKRVMGTKGSAHQSWLTLLLAGGGMFGFVDHLWNGELTLTSANLWADLALGAVITLGILGLWSVLVLTDKFATKATAAST